MLSVDHETAKKTQQELIDLEVKYGAHNYQKLPVVISRGEGQYVWDTDGNRYIDLLGAFASVNQGHCHPDIVHAMFQQSKRLTITSGGFHHDRHAEVDEYITTRFGYDKVLFMNSGGESCETAMKLCRRWAYRVKGIPKNKARIIFAGGNFHGRTLAVISPSTELAVRGEFGPYLPGCDIIPYNDLKALENALQHPHVAGFMVEPLQGHSGVVIPDEGYMAEVARLCKKSNVLLMADEIQSGCCRTGKMLCCDHENVRPDILLLGKGLSGGFFPISACLADDEIMLTIGPGEHGSTFSASPIGCQVVLAALRILDEEHLAERSARLGKIFRSSVGKLMKSQPYLSVLRGKGLFNAIGVAPMGQLTAKEAAWQLCLHLKGHGVIATPAIENIIRITPPLVITEKDLEVTVEALRLSMEELVNEFVLKSKL